jgi:Protein of unknown function (DUF1194)
VDKADQLLANESNSIARAWRAACHLVAISFAGAVAACTLGVADTAAQTRVDVELVIAVDVSLSMDADEQRLQREGYVAAFRDRELQRAIASGVHGRIAVAYMEWAGPTSQSVVIPWTVIDGPDAARAFADRLAAQPISRLRLTSIGAALQFARGLLSESGFAGTRRVVDISGDGPNNSGPPAPIARDALVADGVVVNGLPIMLKSTSPTFFDLTDLDRYYASCVIGGAGSFMVPVNDIAELKSAIRRKLLLEISGLGPPPRLILAQDSEAESYDCFIGERQWRWYMDGAPN